MAENRPISDKIELEEVEDCEFCGKPIEWRPIKHGGFTRDRQRMQLMFEIGCDRHAIHRCKRYIEFWQQRYAKNNNKE